MRSTRHFPIQKPGKKGTIVNAKRHPFDDTVMKILHTHPNSESLTANGATTFVHSNSPRATRGFIAKRIAQLHKRKKIKLTSNKQKHSKEKAQRDKDMHSEVRKLLRKGSPARFHNMEHLLRTIRGSRDMPIEGTRRAIYERMTQLGLKPEEVFTEKSSITITNGHLKRFKTKIEQKAL